MKKLLASMMLTVFLLVGCMPTVPVNVGTVTQVLLNVLAWNCASENRETHFLNSGFVGNVFCNLIPLPTVTAPPDFESIAADLLREALTDACMQQQATISELNFALQVTVTLLCSGVDEVPSFTNGVIEIVPN